MIDNNIRVLILAAGFGTRLKEIGINLPKGLIPYKTTTILGRVISELNKISSIYETALISNSHFFSLFEKFFSNNFPEFKLTLVNNKIETADKRLGAIGDLIFALDQLNWWDKDLLVLPSDTYFDFSFEELLAFYKQKKNFVTVLRKMDKKDIANRLGCALVKNNQVIEFVEKPEQPKSEYAAIPFYIYPKKILALLKEYKKEGNNLDAPGSIVGWLIKKKVSVWAFITNTKTLDVGTKTEIDILNSWK